jgi:hypothetical protein
MSFKVKTNPVTGVDEVEFGAKLLSVGTEVKERDSDAKTKYRLANISFQGPTGKTLTSVAMMNEENFKKISDAEGKCTAIGRELLCVGTKGESGMLFTISHLDYAERVNVDEFASVFTAAEASEAAPATGGTA